MAKRKTEQLAAAGLQKKKPGLHADGAGLGLQVTKAGARSWIFRFTLRGRAREMGLGPLHTVSLSEARIAARACRQQLRDGLDPIEARRAMLDSAAASQMPRTTFAEYADRFIKAKESEWKNAKHREQWRNTLSTYAYPFIGARAVADIDTDAVVSLLEPIWPTKTETATRVRQRVEAVLDSAIARELRAGPNPARWKGHLDMLLSRPTKVRKVKHHAALPYAEVAGFVNELREQPGNGARALEFTVLTAARTGEVIGAKWDEIDLKAKAWTIPAKRMKAGRDHRVPLSVRAVEILKGADPDGSDSEAFVFPGQSGNGGLSNMTLSAALKRMGRTGITVHGFRSTFRDWAAETTSYPHEMVEFALAHTIKDKTEAAYRRGDMFAKRAALMADWATYCARDPKQRGKVIPMRQRA